eukprot:COSAG05_NODE_7832_length_765_cov_1.076577_1_plen_83_part_00
MDEFCQIGNYFPANESFVVAPASATGGQQTAQLEHGQAGWWGAQGGAANNERMMMIGAPLSHIHTFHLGAPYRCYGAFEDNP